VPLGHGQEDESGEHHPREHGEVAIHLTGEVDVDQAEGEGPEKGDEDEVFQGLRNEDGGLK